jgi:hypothetical protein
MLIKMMVIIIIMMMIIIIIITKSNSSLIIFFYNSPNVSYIGSTRKETEETSTHERRNMQFVSSRK